MSHYVIRQSVPVKSYVYKALFVLNLYVNMTKNSFLFSDFMPPGTNDRDIIALHLSVCLFVRMFACPYFLLYVFHSSNI